MKLHSFNIETVQKVGSTNLLMRDREQSGRLKHGDVLRAIFQNEGLGQSGNMWESETGKNLTFSMFLETNFIKAEDVFILNKIISLALWTYLNDRNVQELKIKWPNDIYVGENKIAGILTQNSFLGDEFEHSMVGIGININQINFLSDAPNPTSLKKLLGLEFNLEVELDKILSSIQYYFNRAWNGEYSFLNETYIKHLYGYGKMLHYKDKLSSFVGMIIGVDEYGHLLIEKENKRVYSYDMKEIIFL